MNTTPNVRTTLAALNTLMADRPELAELPVYWKVEQDGSMHLNPRYRGEGSHAAVRVLAAALGFETYEYTVLSEETGELLNVISAGPTARFAGAQVYATGYELAGPALAAAEGGGL
jgi:hypothetical protein